MSRFRLPALLLVVAYTLGACREVKPTATNDTPPLTDTKAATLVSPNPQSTQSPSIPSSPSLTMSLPSVPLPSCKEVSDIELKDLAITFVAEWDGDNEIYFVQADNSEPIQVTQNSSGDIGSVWSPDGDQIAFVINRYTNPRLYIIDTDTLEGVIVAPNLEVSSLDLVWAPSGESIVFRSLDDLYAVDVETSEVISITHGESFSPGTPSFSPDGSKMVFLVNMLQGTPRHRMFTVRVDGTELKELSFPQGDVFRPTWHPFKNEILFEGVVEGDGIGLYIASLDGAIRKLPLEPEYRAPEPAWSPDGSMVGYIVRLSDFNSSGERLSLHSLHIATVAGDVDLVVLNPTGEPDAGLTISAFFWAPDSRHIAYTIPSDVGGSGEVDLYVLNICDGTSSLIVEAIDAFSTPSWRPMP